MSKKIQVQFDSDGVERRNSMPICRIKLSNISSIVEFDNSWTSRITLNNGQRFLVDSAADVLSEIRRERKEAIEAGAVTDPVLDDIHLFRLVKEEPCPQSWLGRIFADATQFIRGNDDPLPPLRVTHDTRGQKLTRAQIREIYTPEGSVREEVIASRPFLAP